MTFINQNPTVGLRTDTLLYCPLSVNMIHAFTFKFSILFLMMSMVKWQLTFVWAYLYQSLLLILGQGWLSSFGNRLITSLPIDRTLFNFKLIIPYFRIYFIFSLNNFQKAIVTYSLVITYTLNRLAADFGILYILRFKCVANIFIMWVWSIIDHSSTPNPLFSMRTMNFYTFW